MLVRDKNGKRKELTTVRSVLLLLVLFSGVQLYAQQPVEWVFSSKKTGNDKYEIHLSATIDKGWSLLAQAKSENATSTKIKITDAATVSVARSIEERGERKKKRTEEGRSTVEYFDDKAEFVIVATKQRPDQAYVKGTISYIAFSNDKTLPPFDVYFSIPLQ